MGLDVTGRDHGVLQVFAMADKDRSPAALETLVPANKADALSRRCAGRVPHRKDGEACVLFIEVQRAPAALRVVCLPARVAGSVA